MKHSIQRFGYVLLALVLAYGTPALADAEKAEDSGTPAKQKAQESKPSSDAKPSAHTVKKGLLKIEVEIDGVFEAQQKREMSLRPQVWSGLTVLRSVEHGARVKQGDLLVALDLEKIDRAISDLRSERKLAALALKLAEEELHWLEKSTPLDLAAGERAQRIANEDLDRYHKVNRPMLVKSAHYLLESAKNSLEYQQEELR